MTSMPLGRYLIVSVHNGQADWDQSELVDKTQTPDPTLPPMRDREGTAGDVWRSPVLHVAGQDFRSDQ